MWHWDVLHLQTNVSSGCLRAPIIFDVLPQTTIKTNPEKKASVIFKTLKPSSVMYMVAFLLLSKTEDA